MKKQTTPGIEVYDALKTPDSRALKTIQGGRLKGMTDIKPQWRTQRMTEVFGLCGFGWKYDSPTYTYQTIGQEVNVVCVTNLYIKQDGVWSDPIPGVGGSKVATVERSGVYVSDEAEKMALTDALSVAMKQIGMAADVYIGYSDSKYIQPDSKPTQPVKPTKIVIRDKTFLPDDYDKIAEELSQITDIDELREIYATRVQLLKDKQLDDMFIRRSKEISQ
jgi:hypothetical protein